MESAASHKPNLPPPPPVDDNPQPKQDGDKVESSSSGDEIVKASRRSSGASSSDGSELDLELGVVVETRDCRICHLSLDEESGGLPIELGCSCKDDLAASHRHCAEAWFKIKGNVAGPTEAETAVDQWSEGNDQAAVAAAAAATSGNPQAESNPARHFWQGHRFLNFLLACMVFAFVISWLFHFNVPS
ncbi:hypothetical protein LINPERPRIM_LOCUS9543 [Linum perenne]